MSIPLSHRISSPTEEEQYPLPVSEWKVDPNCVDRWPQQRERGVTGTALVHGFIRNFTEIVLVLTRAGLSPQSGTPPCW